MRYRWLSVFVFLIVAGLAQAQDQNPPPLPTPNDDLTISPINFDQVVVDTVTNGAIYDWWQINVAEDDVFAVEMQAYQGLSPLIGVLSPTQELVSRSDENRPPEPDTLATIQYRATVGGLYTIVATREGNNNGTTTGAYYLRVLKVNQIPDRENELAPVEFRCDAQVATNALMMAFQDEIPATVEAGAYREQYRLTMYGQNDFTPLILADSDLVKTGRLDCNSDASAVLGNTYTLPGAAPITITEAEQSHAAQMTLQNTSLVEEFGEVRLTLGSLNGGTGPYMAVLEGLELEDSHDTDTIILRPGPLTAQKPIIVYVVGENPGRLDLSLQAYASDGTLITACDDAGRAACADVPSFVGAGGTFLEGETPSIIGDRFDAGIILPTGITTPMSLDISSGDTGTRGRYTVFVIGELPPNK